jgi:hypothetical protein
LLFSRNGFTGKKDRETMYSGKWLHCSKHNIDYKEPYCPKCAKEWEPDMSQVMSIEDSLKKSKKQKKTVK